MALTYFSSYNSWRKWYWCFSLSLSHLCVIHSFGCNSRRCAPISILMLAMCLPAYSTLEKYIFGLCLRCVTPMVRTTWVQSPLTCGYVSQVLGHLTWVSIAQSERGNLLFTSSYRLLLPLKYFSSYKPWRKLYVPMPSIHGSFTPCTGPLMLLEF